MRFHFLIILLIASFQVAGQVTLVSYKTAKDVDFESFKTFKFYEIDINTIPEIEPRKEGMNLFLQSVKAKLENRGLTLDSDNPDLLINTGVTISTEERTRETNITDAPRYMGQRNYSWQSEEIVIGEFNEGTVVVDFIDVANSEMIWQGVVKGVLTDKASINDKRIKKSVDKLFKKFPIEPKK